MSRWPRHFWFRARSAAPCWRRHWRRPRSCRPGDWSRLLPRRRIVRHCWCSRIFRSQPNWTPAYFQQTLNELTELTREVCQPAARQRKSILIVWPESPAPFFTNDPRFREAVSEMARDTKTWTVAGAIGTSSAAGSGRTDFARVQLRRIGQPQRRLDRALRQGASRALRRISAVSQPVFLCRRLDQGSRRVSARRLAQAARLRATSDSASSSATNPYFPMRSASSPTRARRYSSTFPMTDGTATAAPTRST